MSTAKGHFEVSSWEEDTYEEIGDGAMLTRAAVTQTFAGDVEGHGSAQWLMSYRDDGTAHFVGLQLIRGSIGDRSGSFVLETTGEFDGKVARWSATVVPGSGQGELHGLVGSGTFAAPYGERAAYELDCRFE